MEHHSIMDLQSTPEISRHEQISRAEARFERSMTSADEQIMLSISLP